MSGTRRFSLRAIPRPFRARQGVVISTTDPITARAFLVPHLDQLRQLGVSACLVSAPSPLLSARPLSSSASWPITHLVRAIRPLWDLLALAEITWALIRIRPAALQVGTPKAGLLVTFAGFLTRVPRRQYVVHGLRYETAGGNRRRLLMVMEGASCACATSVIAVSDSVRNRLIEDGVVRPEKVKVLGAGSISGVDVSRFIHNEDSARRFRSIHGLDLNIPLVLFVGRLANDKGVSELATAWSEVRRRGVNAQLVVVGPVDESDPLAAETVARIGSLPGVLAIGFLEDPAPAYSAADLLVLPSYREGFGTVILEAAAAGVPSVATDVTGLRDAVVHGQTGLLVAPRTVLPLAEAIQLVIEDEGLRQGLGRRAKARVQRDFLEATVVQRYIQELTS